ncbi:MAG TPA: VWA domain-containing protein [Bryobacteraceae bacterium]|nr:VWA domain-containing protein [Bryobacteraceae bacterium]
MVRRKLKVLACCLVLLAPAVLCAQVSITPRPRPAPIEDKTPKANIRVDTNLVLIPVTVCNPYNQPVTGLEKEHFKIFDDKVEQTITHFSMDDEPVSVGLVFDVSGSMGNKLRESRQAAAEFFKTANKDDEFFLVEFSDTPRLVSPMGTSVADIQNELTFSPSKGRTALLDAVFLAMHEMKKSQKNRKALLIISDGGDNASRYTETELRNLVRESDTMIYAIGVFESAANRSRTPEEAMGPSLLSELCEQTGGRHFPAEISELPDIAAKIGVELRNRYVLGYIPTDQQHDGRYHPVVVKVIPPHGLPPLHAYWRRGYYAPSN